MTDFIFVRALTNTRRLCISPLPNSTIEKILPLTRANQYSYYLYEIDDAADDDDVVILAKLVSEDAAIHLKESLNLEYA
jgi:hypothetical protein